MKKGFTLIELLVVLSIAVVMLFVVLPVSYSTYKNYQNSLEVEKVLMFFSSLRRDSFLHSKENLIDAEYGDLKINGEEKVFKGIHFQTEKPIMFYKNGTTSGGKVQLKMGNNNFFIDIQSPSGDLKLIRE